MSWLSRVRELFTTPERPVDLRGVPGPRDPQTLSDPPPVAATSTAVLVERGDRLVWETTATNPPSHTIYIDGDDRPYHHVREHEGTWVYQRM